MPAAKASASVSKAAETVASTAQTVAKKVQETVVAPVVAKSTQPEIATDGTGVLSLDPWLEPFKDALRSRFSHAQKWIKTIEEHEGGLDKFSKV